MIINARNKNIELGKKTLIMGILNVTIDSFSDGGEYVEINTAFNHAKEMIDAGTDIIDIGGMSTRPGHEEISIDLEIKRVVPVIKKIATELDTIISIDTYRWEVAKEALEAGAHIINDIWGLQKDNGEMAKLANEYNACVIAMHNQNNTKYQDDIMISERNFFKKTFEIAKQNNLSKNKIIIDPGIGFGKTAEQNIEILKRLEEIKDIAPILLGTSRKSFLGKILNNKIPKDRIIGTLATTVIGIEKGVDIIRVHDIKENFETILVADKILRK